MTNLSNMCLFIINFNGVFKKKKKKSTDKFVIEDNLIIMRIDFHECCV